LREKVRFELATSEHTFAETKDPEIESIVVNKNIFGRQPTKQEKMSEKEQSVVNNFKIRANEMMIPEFPWNPHDEEEREKIHEKFQNAQNICNEVEYRRCPKCNLKKLRNSIKGLHVCPNCIGNEKQDDTLKFVIKYKFPKHLGKLNQAEAAAISYFQPAITVTFNRKDGKRYRLQTLVLTKQPDSILKAVTSEFPRKQLEDIINKETTVK
jgi:hypothetical protein